MAEESFRLQRCVACGTYWFPPGPVCTKCLSLDWAWRAVAGHGVVLTHCTFHQSYFPGLASLVPYHIAVVQLNEGPKVISNLVPTTADGFRIGDQVKIAFTADSEGFVVPVFEASRE